MQYTIESRPLTSESAHRKPYDGQPRQIQIEAPTAEDAISQFLYQNASELVSLTTPGRGSESIATVRKGDSVFLVRIYSA
jgi:hypothetical protein